MSKADKSKRRRDEILRSVNTLDRLSTKYSLKLPSEYYFSVARALLESDDKPSARRYLVAGLGKDKANAKAWVDLAQTYFDTNHPREALRVLNRGVRSAGNDPDLWILKGVALGQLGESATALRCFDHPSVAKSSSKSVQHLRFRNRAVVLIGLGRSDRALKDLERAYGLEPDSSTLVLLANICLEADRLAEAAKYATLATKRSRENPHAWNILGVARAMKKDYSRAIVAFRNATRLRPGEIRFLANLSHACEHAGRYREAIEVAKKLLEIDPQNTDGYFFWARALLRAGRQREALKVLQNGLRRARGKEVIQNLLTKTEDGRHDDHSG